LPQLDIYVLGLTEDAQDSSTIYLDRPGLAATCPVSFAPDDSQDQHWYTAETSQIRGFVDCQPSMNQRDYTSIVLAFRPSRVNSILMILHHNTLCVGDIYPVYYR
jgi:hypothetical protein